MYFCMALSVYAEVRERTTIIELRTLALQLWHLGIVTQETIPNRAEDDRPSERARGRTSRLRLSALTSIPTKGERVEISH